MAVERALKRGNPFVEPDIESLRDRTNEGHSVFRVRTRIMIMIEEISGDEGGEFWDWSTGVSRLMAFTAIRFLNFCDP